MMDFKNQFQQNLDFANQVVLEKLPTEYELQKTVVEAMRYSVDAPGKRLRPILMAASYELFKGDDTKNHCVALKHFMAALEFIHNYSLIHDDLPAMDNDEYRRGRKTTHIVYGEAQGILAGDGLLNYAYEVAARAFDDPDTDIKNIVNALKILTRKAGIYGMVGGQVVDVEMEGQPLNETQIDFIYRLKTSALLECALMVGAALAGATEAEVKVMENVARKVGVAFQIQDDILDITSTTEELGKPVGSDEKNHKMTYASIHGIGESSKMVDNLTKEAVELLNTLHNNSPFLNELLLSLINRKK